MMSRSHTGRAALLAGLLVVGVALQGCVATTVAGATLGVAAGAVRTTAKVGGKVVGATAHVTARAAGRALKGPSRPRTSDGDARDAGT